ncbi:MAG: hypothetical protein DSZ23_04290 [Thermodesulfatator sp.]|nr:MAG: hypothetical protein DSZ23_04290 [Thermodesulfatator sp.]
MISPEQIETEQGRTVRFVGLALPKSASDLRLLWSLPDGREKTDSSFVDVDTSSLEPGSYQVVLRVTDRFGRKASAIASLVVRPAVNVHLEIHPRSIQAGREVQFEAKTSPALIDAEYNFHFTDHNSSGWLGVSKADYKYNDPGTYYCFVEVRKKGRIIATSEKKGVTVVPVPEPGEELAVYLSSNASKIFLDQNVTVSVKTIPQREDLVFRLDFGDQSEKDQWSELAMTTHSYSDPGIYRVKAYVRTPKGKIFESRELVINVMERTTSPSSFPDWGFWLAAILFAVSYGVFKIKRKKNKEESGRFERSGSEVRMKLKSDEGAQEIICEKALLQGPEIRIHPITDLGIQETQEE